MVDVGDVFAVPLGDERFGLCRVLAAEKPLGPWDRNRRWRVASCEWVGRENEIAAALADATRMKVQKRTINAAIARAFAVGGQKQTDLGRWDVQSIGGPPPAELRKVGVLAPSAADRKLPAERNPGAWKWVATRVLAELEFREGPDAVRARWEAAKERDRQTLEAARADDKARKARAPKSLVPVPAGALTLAQLGRKRPLGGWRTGKAEWIAATREVLAALVQQLIARPARTPTPVLAAVTRATRALNKIDAAHDHPYVTTDAEALVEALLTIGIAAGVDEDTVALTIDEARDW